jgi:hypothetical protein
MPPMQNKSYQNKRKTNAGLDKLNRSRAGITDLSIRPVKDDFNR